MRNSGLFKSAFGFPRTGPDATRIISAIESLDSTLDYYSFRNDTLSLQRAGEITSLYGMILELIQTTKKSLRQQSTNISSKSNEADSKK